MDMALGIIFFVAIGLSISGGLIVCHRMQNHLRHGRAPGAERIDLRRQGYGPKPR